MTPAEWEAEKVKVDQRRGDALRGMGWGSTVPDPFGQLRERQETVELWFPYLREVWVIFDGPHPVYVTDHPDVVENWRNRGHSVVHLREVAK